LGVRPDELSVDDIKARRNLLEVGRRCIDSPRRDGDGNSVRLFQILTGGDLPNAMALAILLR